MKIPMGWHRFADPLRVGWIVLRLVLALWMARSGTHFYYQGF